VRDPLLVQAQATTREVGRTFALACRVLPRGVRDDIYLLYLVFGLTLPHSLIVAWMDRRQEIMRRPDRR
jgi:hypothetical protein